MNKTLHTFEALIIDATGRAEITTVKSLIMALSYSEKLWKEVVVNSKESNFLIEDNVLGITLQASKVPSNQGIAFIVHVTSQTEQALSDFREKLLVHAIQKLDFTVSRILTDTLSEDISVELFARIKAVENSLRKYLDKALTQKIGVSWWESVPTESVLKNVGEKSGLASSCSSLVDSRISLTDFSDLSLLIEQTGFADNQFLSKWESLKTIRTKVLTYSLFSNSEKESAERTTQELLDWISNAANNIATTTFKAVTPSPAIAAVREEKQEVKEIKKEVNRQEEVLKSVQAEVTIPVQPAVAAIQVDTQTAEPKIESKKAEEPFKASKEFADLITENVLLEELKAAQNELNGRFVDLKSFVTKTLANKGYAFGPAYVVAKNMNEKGLVQIYDTKDDKGILVKAIKAK